MGGVLRVSQVVQREVGRDDQRLAAAVTAVGEGVAREFCEKLLAGMFLDHGLERGHSHTLLGGLAVVVLLLYFEEGVVRVEIGAHPHLGARPVPTLMRAEHDVLLGVFPICGLIGAVRVSARILREITAASHLQQFLERFHVGDELRVHSVHQSDGRHFVERDGRHIFHNPC